MKQEIKVKFLGGAQEVGRSAFLVECGDKILLDYGVKLDPHGTQYPQRVHANLNAAIISHAHLDHSGNLPHLFTDSTCLTYMTPPTLEIAKLLWHDSLKIAGLEGMDASFSKEEIKRTEKYTFPVPYKKRMEITHHSSMELIDAGHILGAAMVKLYLGRKNLLYTGDFKIHETRLHSGADLSSIGKVDYLIIESTYGDRNQRKRKETEKEFVEEVQNTIDRGGHALITAFAVGRSQEVIDILNEYKIDAPIHYDGMGQAASRIYTRYPEYLKDPKFLRSALANVHWVSKMSARKRALAEPSIIVTTSGMLAGGPVHAYLPFLHADKNSFLFLTGYQVKETPGRILLDTGIIDLDGLAVKPKMQYKKFEFSAHADKSELMKLIKLANPEKVVCVHGDPETMQVFKQDIEEEGFEALTPNIGDQVKL